MFGVLKGFKGGQSEYLQEIEDRKALKTRIDAKDKAQKDELEAMLKRVHEVIQAFDNQWLAKTM